MTSTILTSLSSPAAATTSHSNYGSPETMLNRRFQNLMNSTRSGSSKKKRGSRNSNSNSNRIDETNKLIASMTVRSLVMTSGASGIYRKALDTSSSSIIAATTSGNSGRSKTGETTNDGVSPRFFGGKDQSSSSSSVAASSSSVSRLNATSNFASAQIAFYSNLASLKAYNFDQTHADLLLRNPQATVLGMATRDTTASSSQEKDKSVSSPPDLDPTNIDNMLTSPRTFLLHQHRLNCQTGRLHLRPLSLKINTTFPSSQCKASRRASRMKFLSDSCREEFQTSCLALSLPQFVQSKI